MSVLLAAGNEPLPRRTYKTAEHEEDETRIAEVFARWAKAGQLKIGIDFPDRQKSRIDRLLYRNQAVVAFFEVKTTGYTFGYFDGGWCTGLKKVEACRELRGLVCVPVLLVVEFLCGRIAYVDTAAEVRIRDGFGRKDRDDAADIVRAACFDWKQFRTIRESTR